VAWPLPAASTHPHPAKPAAAAVAVGEELSVAVEVEDISLDSAAGFPSAYPTDHSYAEVEAGIQAGSYRVLELGIAAAAAAAAVGSELVEVGRLLRRQNQGLRLRRDP
jgi:hypothetical protein